jgi:hypothetical protein
MTENDFESDSSLLDYDLDLNFAEEDSDSDLEPMDSDLALDLGQLDLDLNYLDLTTSLVPTNSIIRRQPIGNATRDHLPRRCHKKT